MTGALLAVGLGRMSADDVAARLALGSSQLPGAGGAWRGYNVAPAKGLLLQGVQYPAGVDDAAALLYPGMPHDEWGRLLLRAMRGGGGSRGADED